ncbi:MAG: PAS domain S-box protein [Planctomycetaceae bacterium]|nr:PAS domain S-box protein [Planctomycetaceae bacterium]
MHNTAHPQIPPLRRILIVDDNPAIHEDYRRVLCNDEAGSDDLVSAKALLLGGKPSIEASAFDIELVSAFQGEEALELVRQSVVDRTPFQLAFVDVRMPPGIDGIETISRLWEIDPAVQIVICTAFSDYSWEETNANLKNSDKLLILKKPFEIAVVRQMACSLIAKHELAEQVEQHLAEMARETKYTRAIIDSSNEAYLEADGDGRIIDWGSKAEDLFGWNAEEVCGKHLNELLKSSGGASETIRELLAELATRNTGKRCELIAIRQDGRELPVEASISSLDLDGVRMFHAFVHDITSRHKLQTQLGHAQKMESVGHLAAGIAHEINTPTQYVGDNTRFLLDAFSDFAEVLGKYDELIQAAKSGAINDEIIAATEAAIAKADIDYLLDEVPNAINQSLEGVGRIATIVRAMKAFSHPGQKEKSDTDIHQAIEGAITISRNEWKCVAEVETDFDPEMPLVSCQAGDVNQVFLNLIVNAAHAIGDVVGASSGELGKITITTKLLDDWAELRFADSGTGIAEENRGKLYDAFFTTKQVGKGTGQGLAIAHSIIVEGHDGTIDFETEVGKGTTFIICLPLHHARNELSEELADTMIG